MINFSIRLRVRLSMKVRVVVMLGSIIRSIDECEMLCSCQRVMFSRVGTMVVRMICASLHRFLFRIGLRLCGIVFEFF